MKNLTKQFADWVNKQPRDKEYNYFDVQNCALAQFGKSLGYAEARGGSTEFVTGTRGHAIDVLDYTDPRQHRMVCDFPWTFGALADRLKEAGI